MNIPPNSSPVATCDMSDSVTVDSPVWAVGLMTGTVLDGNIDVALLKTDGERIVEFGQYSLVPYKPATVELLRQCQQQALVWQFEGSEPDVFAQAQEQLTFEQTQAVSQLLEQYGIEHQAVSVVGFHGQTVLHRPPSDERLGMTRQLSDGALMARMLGIDVVDDFRSRDMRAGGQGAPLSAVYHKALLKSLHTESIHVANMHSGNNHAASSAPSEKPYEGCDSDGVQFGADTAVLNLGGVANLSWWDGADSLIAFDTGPANAPINDFVQHMGYADYDDEGQLAASGQVDEHRLSTLLRHPYLHAQYPKSLDRFDFTWRMAEGLNLADGAALLTAFSAASVGCALDLLARRPRRLIVCGGGRHNLTLMRMLGERTGADVVPAEAVGWRGDAIEAECFAYLAVRSLRAKAISYPQTTGVNSPTRGGVIHRYLRT